jgi:hypothetical protein
MKTHPSVKSKFFLAILVIVVFGLNSCSKDETSLPASANDAVSLKISGPSESSSTITHLPGLVYNIFGNPPTSEGSILYNPLTGTTIGAMDGHLITYGDYLKVSGDVTLRCTNRGTQLSLHMSDLFPGATYSIWIETFQAPGYEGNISNRIGMGAFGKTNGTNNVFKASASGEGQISINLSAGPLSMNGTVSNCLVSDEFEYHIIGIYHIYGTTYGPTPGPQAYYVEHFRYIFSHP